MSKVADRVTAWKKVFTQGMTEVNEKSSWRDIILALKRNEDKIETLFGEAKQSIGTFIPAEKRRLSRLPYYLETKDLMEYAETEIWGNFFRSDPIPGDSICYVRHPMYTVREGDVEYIDVTIVTKEPVKLDTDLCLFFFKDEDGLEFDRVVSITYSDKEPQEWRDKLDAWVKALEEN